MRRKEKEKEKNHLTGQFHKENCYINKPQFSYST